MDPSTRSATTLTRRSLSWSGAAAIAAALVDDAGVIAIRRKRVTLA
jgi:hypothetical protein